MNDKDLEVLVEPPLGKIVTRGRPIEISNVFMQDEFALRLLLSGQVFTWNVTLPEWLEALTLLLNMKGDSEVRRLLTLSGEHFVARKNGDNIAIKIFDTDLKRELFVDLTTSQAKMLHAEIAESLVRTVREAMDSHVEILGLETILLHQ
ncbi:MAG: hypothetical protein ACK52K_12310 [Alphaproteobacteria bacterium]